MSPTLKALWKWIRTPNRRWIDFPPKAALTLFVAYWWFCWGLTNSIVTGFWAVLFTIGVLIAWVLLLKVYDRRAELIDEGLEVPWWRLPFNLASSGKKFGDVDERWAKYTSAQKVSWNGIEPKLLRKKLTPGGEVRAFVSPGSLGGDMARISADAATGVLTGVMDCKEVSISPVGDGAGWVTFWKTSPLAETRSVLDLPPSGTSSLSFGWQNDGKAATVPYGFNLLVGAASGAGKSKFTWNLWFDLVRDQTPTLVHVIDPKGEMKWFRGWVGKTFGDGHIKVASYMTTLAEAEAHFATLRRQLHERQDMLPPGEDLDDPTDEMPGVLTIIDEGLDVAPLFQAGMAKTDMGVYMSQGRSTKDFVWMSVQVATVQEIGGIRKAFQFRASLRQTSAEDTKAVLGIGENEGVPCSSIPFDMRGVGYYVTEEGVRMKFRTADVGKTHVRHLMTTGKLPENMMTRDLARELRNGQRPHYGYRAYGLVKGRPVHIYSGETNKRDRRYAEHRRDDIWKGRCPFPGCGETDCSWWAKHVDHTTSGVFAGEPAARDWESAEIHALQPMFNIAGAGNNRHVHLSRLTYRGPKFERDGAVVKTPRLPGRRRPKAITAVPEPAPVKPLVAEPVRRRLVPASELEAAVPAPRPRPRRKVRPEPALVGRNEHLTHIPGYGESE